MPRREGTAQPTRTTRHEVSLQVMMEESLLEQVKTVPLRIKLLVGDLAVMAIAGCGAWLMWRIDPATGPLAPVLLFAVLGVVGLTTFHMMLVPRALEPLRHLEQAARAIRTGAQEVEIEVSAFADPELQRVVEVFGETVRETAELRSRLHTLAMRSLEAGEERLQEVSSRLHDDIAQRLATLVVRLRLAEGSEDPEKREVLLHTIRDETRATLEAVRLMARGLRTPELDDLGLGPALRAFGRSVAERNGPEMVFEIAVSDTDLSPHQTIGLYRILQEAVYNTVRHAGARVVEIRLFRRDDRTVAEVVDDGCGFDPAWIDRDEKPCLGLLAMEERARNIGGSLSLESEPGRGTVVRVEVPDRASLDCRTS